MDLNDLRNLITVVSFFIFAGIMAWALAGRNKARFDEAQMLPFVDEGLPPAAAQATGKGPA